MNSQAINELAIKISLKHVREDENKPKIYVFPIKKICDIEVTVQLVRIANTKGIYKLFLEIEANHAHKIAGSDRIPITLYENYYDKPDDVSIIEFYKETLISIRDKIKNFKFDKLNGKLVEKLEEDDKLLLELFEDCENIEFNWQECCCCKENTITKTECEHPLCVLCWSNLKRGTDDDYNEMIFQRCPICRNELYY